MGELYLHDLNSYIDRHGLTCFVETGTGKGTGLAYALQCQFKKWYSIEIEPVLFAETFEKFGRIPGVKLILDNSVDGLDRLLPRLADERVLFWLDAHFPGADFQLARYDDEPDPSVRLPLMDELKVIAENRQDKADVLIIDDLRLFEEGCYEDKIPDDFRSAHADFSVIPQAEKLFGDSHVFTRDYRQQGFMILEPKDGAL